MIPATLSSMRRLVPLLCLLAAAIHAQRELRAPSAVQVAQAAELEPVKRGERRRGVRPDRGERPYAELGALDEAMPRRPDEVRARLRASEAGTYIAEILASRDSTLVRWPERMERPLRVWVASGEGQPDWHDFYADRVRDAFLAWQQTRIPMRFVFVVDSADADVHVNWVDRFDAPISGKTLWSRDKRWWIVGGTITLALHHSYGDPLDGNAIYAIALHEVGHLLGLDHTSDAANIMTPRVRVRDLSPADRATVRLLYSLPPGSIR